MNFLLSLLSLFALTWTSTAETNVLRCFETVGEYVFHHVQMNVTQLNYVVSEKLSQNFFWKRIYAILLTLLVIVHIIIVTILMMAHLSITIQCVLRLFVSYFLDLGLVPNAKVTSITSEL